MSIFLFILLLLGILYGIYWSGYHPPLQQTEKIIQTQQQSWQACAPTLKVMSWNVQCMFGNINSLYHFDGGRDPVTTDYYQQTLQSIATVIQQQQRMSCFYKKY